MTNLEGELGLEREQVLRIYLQSKAAKEGMITLIWNKGGGTSGTREAVQERVGFYSLFIFDASDRAIG